MKFALCVGLLLVVACGGCQQAAMQPSNVGAVQPTKPPAVLPKDMTLDLGNGVTMQLVLIPAGKFLMGSPESERGRDSDETQHKVTISKPFYMSVMPVTQVQYQMVLGKNPSYFKGMTNPVGSVSWNDATEFCKKLSEKTHQTVRLPTEAEWEYACRAGTKTYISFFDNELALGDYAWYNGISSVTTHPVGQKQPNAWGLYDMNYNVYEWCADWYGEYPKGAVIDPQGSPSGAGRVLRGGVRLGGDAGRVRCAFRDFNSPNLSDPFYGFRMVVSVPYPNLP